MSGITRYIDYFYANVYVSYGYWVKMCDPGEIVKF